MALTNQDKTVMKFYVEDMMKKIHSGIADSQTVVDFVALDDPDKVLALKEWALAQRPVIQVQLNSATSNQTKYQNQVDFIDSYTSP